MYFTNCWPDFSLPRHWDMSHQHEAADGVSHVRPGHSVSVVQRLHPGSAQIPGVCDAGRERARKTQHV